jgi:hypothetical protein
VKKKRARDAKKLAGTAKKELEAANKEIAELMQKGNQRLIQ